MTYRTIPSYYQVLPPHRTSPDRLGNCCTRPHQRPPSLADATYRPSGAISGGLNTRLELLCGSRNAGACAVPCNPRCKIPSPCQRDPGWQSTLTHDTPPSLIPPQQARPQRDKYTPRYQPLERQEDATRSPLARQSHEVPPEVPMADTTDLPEPSRVYPNLALHAQTRIPAPIPFDNTYPFGRPPQPPSNLTTSSYVSKV